MSRKWLKKLRGIEKDIDLTGWKKLGYHRGYELWARGNERICYCPIKMKEVSRYNEYGKVK